MTLNVQKTTTIVAGAWHHIALVRNGNNFMIFEDGTQLGTTVTDTDPVPDLTGVARLGTSDGTNWPLAGRIDEFILSKGIARWTSAFTPGPTNTPTATATKTKTPTPTVTSTASKTATVTQTVTATATKTVTPTNTVGASQTPVASNTPTATATASPTATTVPATNFSASFVYDGNGAMVLATINDRPTVYVSAAYQIANPNTAAASVTKYYQGGAMRVGGTVYYTLSDHIGSTSLTLDASGNKTADMRYKAWGEVRYQNGNLQTDRTYTGQRTYSDDFGLMFYNARWYDTSIGHFAQADNIEIEVGGIQSLDRYSYVMNNPILYNDPSGHSAACDQIPAGSARDACNNSGYNAEQTEKERLAKLEQDFLNGTGCVGLDGLQCDMARQEPGYKSISQLEQALIIIAVAGLAFGAPVAGAIVVDAAFAASAAAAAEAANIGCGGDMCADEAKNTLQTIQNALQILAKSGVRPGQTVISSSKITNIVKNYDPSKAQSVIYKAGDGTRYLVDGHHTTVAATILGRAGPFMGQATRLMPSATNVFWTRQPWEFWKPVIEIID